MYSYKYLGVQINNKLDWSHNTDALFRKGQRRLRSFSVCNRLLKIFYQSIVASALFFTVVCWGGGIGAVEASRLNKLVRKKLDSQSVAERRMKDKIKAILDNHSHPLYDELWMCVDGQFSQPPNHPSKTEHVRRSFVPAAIRLYNSSAISQHSQFVYLIPLNL